ncbi:Legume-like lectin family protein [Trichomonas vaginalis G3]|uniref:Legume-like lectin family protein n=1 Tax=Trichomonas vaginalis (strain ATCC PRA-98 / G3) TaxID=412133 RepID=A2E601_TRIV3|nr:lectin, mannose-binding, 1 family [Trichomonas vaginalis G3]EAY11958.1 Legume-like lectin family protein [Trichomonas vaginalis G3]KAI5530377.1 lectin, mannose-binding, 1 family [Trichomonas vaginalis G3]|eukprot:XP_001324181.1 Legume-like lectin family protein [Trichomonas vaginalis G3]
MFSLLFIHTLQEAQPLYNLVPPMQLTDINEIGNWTIRGTTTVLKNAIRLTCPVKSSFGSVCQRVPTLFKEWSAEIELRAYGGEQPGHGIWFFYTEEVCPSFALKFTGFALWVNTTSTDEEGYSQVYFAKNNGSNLELRSLKPVGKVRFRGEDRKPLRIQMSKRFDTLTVDATKDIVMERILTENVSDIPDYGYFSVSAVTLQNSDNNDLLSFRLYSMSPVDHPNKTFNYSAVNRKYIEDDVKERRELKRKRRLKMPLMGNFTQKLKELNATLNGKQNENLRDAIKIINEAYNRGLETITVQYLEEYIQRSIEQTIDSALSQIELAANQYSETQQDIDNLWSSLKSQLTEMAIEEKTSMATLQSEIILIAKQLNFSKIDPEKIQQNLNNESSYIDDGPHSHILLIISVIELVAYVIFFIYKRQKTNDFKKYD